MSTHVLALLFEAKGAKQVEADVRKIDSAIGRIGAHAKTGLKNAIGNLTALGIAAGGFVAANVYKGIQSLEDLERVTEQTAAVIKSTGGKAKVSADEVHALASAQEDLTTVDDKVVQSGENMLLTFTNIGKDVFPQATKAMVDMAVAMNGGNVEGLDLKTTAIQIGKALQDPIKGATALRKVGVALTDQQQTQIKTLLSLTKDEQKHYLALKKSDKAAAERYKQTRIGSRLSQAQSIILKELNTEFGKAGEAAGKGFGGDMRRFQDAIEDAQMALARGFLPVIREFTNWLTTTLKDPKTLKQITEFGYGLADGFKSALDFAKNIPWGTIGDAMRLAGEGAKAALGFFSNLPPWVQTAVISGWGLNKLTGGALGSIVGELGKGLIKGVLGMNAAVVNINAGVVNGAGGVPGAAAAGGPGAAGLLGPGLGTLGAGIGGILAMYALPVLLAKAGSAKPMETRIGTISPQTADQFRGLMPGFDNLARKFGDAKTSIVNATVASRTAMVTATRAEQSAIVSAIRNQQYQFSVAITGLPTARATVRVTSGGALSRYNGKLVPLG